MYTNYFNEKSTNLYLSFITLKAMLKVKNDEECVEKTFAQIIANYDSRGDIYKFEKRVYTQEISKIKNCEIKEISIIVNDIDFWGKRTTYQFNYNGCVFNKIIEKLEENNERLSVQFSLIFKVIDWKTKEEGMKNLVNGLFEIDEFKNF